MAIITIDGGTTNTRVYLCKDDSEIQNIDISIGIKDCAIDGNNKRLNIAIRDAIREILKQNNIANKDIEFIVASGMITSNLGLYELAHVSAPISVNDLANAMKSALIEDIIDIPIWFIPGIKNFDVTNKDDLDISSDMDIMRGEETETAAILQNYNIDKNTIIILPGSHTKFVFIDSDKRISGCLTSIAGEIINLVTNNSILASSLNKSFIQNIDKEFILKGYYESRKYSFIKSLFSIRVMELFYSIDSNRLANFLMGSVLAEDIRSIENNNIFDISLGYDCIVASKYPYKQAFEIILNEISYFKKLTFVDEKNMKNLTVNGALALYKEKNATR